MGRKTDQVEEQREESLDLLEEQESSSYEGILDLEDEVSDVDDEEEEAPAQDEPTGEGLAPETSPPAEAEEAQDDLKAEAQGEESPPSAKPEEVAEQPNYEEAQQKWRAELQDRYKMSQEDADKFVTSPEEVLPQLAARMHEQIMTETLQAIAQNLPQYIQQFVGQRPEVVSQAVEQSKAKQQAADQFFESFPDLRDHEASVVQVVQMIKADPKNANLTREELVVKAGNATRALLGVQAPAQAPAPAPQQERPFSPAQPGAASAPAPLDTGKSEWDEIIETELI